jgi:NADP-dependent 3-hydroxy acid dehydrogenase YdfG
MKNIVITGSTRGIGLCMAREFLKYGCTVTVSGRNEKSLDSARKELDEFSGRVLYVLCDVRIKTDIENLWKKSVEKWERVDYWINNAGQNCPYEFFYNTGQSYVDAVIDTNIKGMIYGSQVAAKNMLSQGSGQIWNMEGLGSNNMIQANTILYGTTKHALTYFTKGLGKELAGTNIQAGRLSPGMMLTDFITKTPDGERSPVMENQGFRKIFNILADRPETVATFLVKQMLKNTRNNANIVWLTNSKAMLRFASSAFKKRELI